MSRRSPEAPILPILLLAAVVAAPASAQDRPTLAPADYGRWEALAGFQLDPTGGWLVADVRRVDESRELRVHHADGSGEPIVLEQGGGPAFGGDGRWLAYLRVPSPEQAEEAEEDEPVRDRLGLVDLRTGTDTVLFEVRSFAFRDDGAWLAALGYAPADTVGADLIVMHPGEETRTLIGNVEEYAWQDGGRLLAATLRTAWGDANGVVLLEPETGILRTLDSRDARYRELTWREGSRELAVLRSVERDGFEDASHDVLLWRDPSTAPAMVLSGTGREDLPDTLRVTEHAGIEFGADGSTVFVGLRPWERSSNEVDEKESEAPDSTEADEPRADATPTGEPQEADSAESDAVEPADVQVWHWNDDEILRGQESNARRNAARTLLAAWHTGGDRLVVLGTELEEGVDLVEGGRWGLVPDHDPYLFQRRFGDGTADWYRVDPRSGERTLLAREAHFGVATGPEGAPALVYEGDRWIAVDLGTLERTAIEGGGFGRSLFQHDYPGPRPPWGVGGWIEGRPEALLYDEHDVWRADLRSGRAARITRGSEEGRRYRVLDLDPDRSFSDPTVVADGETWWLSVFDIRTKAAGYARRERGDRVSTALIEDAYVAGLTKARAADRYALRMERWDDSPDVFVGDAALRSLRQVTRTNPFQADHAWGRTELLDYTTDAGHDLQAILVYPAGFREGDRYPLILYQYERLSDGLHRYDVPSARDYYNYQVWSQQGYFVLMPDIVYEPGRPGPSALDAVEHALDAAVATGHVDPDRMGLIGHSWGGYQASYLPTRTNRFAAAVAGAAITDFISFMGAVHWNGGLPETGHWETGQARMAVPVWQDLEGHLESSPVNFIDELETPVLLMHGDADGVVDFRQGLEYYNFARRAGKEVVLLVYPGADHGLREEPHQVDYHRRILEWFGHYLKGEPAAKWIAEGESWEERARRIGR